MFKLKNFKKGETGNALFLILIAVALFAALSYAVTQSGRGGGGVDREQALIAASQLTQYAAGLRTAVTRMTITGTSPLNLDFEEGTILEDRVFHSSGGGAIEQEPPSTAGPSPAYEYMVPSSATTGWFIEDIGGADNTVPDVIVAATGLAQNVCQEINRGLGFDTVTPQVNGSTVAYATGATWDGDAAQATVFDATPGEPFACVQMADNSYVYYHALVEQ